MKRKYDLPLIHNFSLDIDLKKLQAECDRLSGKYIDVVSANPNLCMNHQELVKDVYANFEQINLTTANENELLDFTADVKERIKRREELLYHHPSEDYKSSYFEEIVKKFKSPAIRVRITKLAPHTSIPFHIDYDPSYAVRVIVPIYTNPKVINSFKKKNEIFEYHLEEGNAYFLNTGFSHAVFNNSDMPRIALMFSLENQDDLEYVS